MIYRMMKNGDSLSVLGFGCMRLPKKGSSIDEERAIKQIRYAIDHGVNYFDTALMYPGSEHILSLALADGYRDKVKIATKVPPAYLKTREDMDRLLSMQLKTLNTDRIDYYLMHMLQSTANWEKLKDLDVMSFFEAAKADGRIRNAGFSAHCPVGDFKEIVDAYDWDFCLIQYSFMDEKNQAGTEGLKYAAAKGLGVIVMEPLRGGYLANNVPPKAQVIWDKAPVRRTPAEWALRWVWDHPEVTVVLSGMNEETHIEENLRIADQAHPGSLTAEELDLVKQVRDVYRSELRIGCTGCRYCMPCPAGVDIPACFTAYNVNSSQVSPKLLYMMTVGGGSGGAKPAFASLCKGCGKCEKVCPQHLPIQKNLKQVAKELETFDAKLIGKGLKYVMGFMRWNTMRKT